MPLDKVLRLLACALALGGCAAQKPAPVDDRRTAAVRPAPRPVPEVAEVIPAAPPFHVVRRGETLYSIALEHGLDYRDVARWNGLDDPAKLRVGQELRLASPESIAAAQAPTSAQVGSARVPGPIEARPLGPAPGPGAAPAGPIPEGVRTSPQALRLPYSEQNLAALSRGEIRPEPAKPPPAVAAVPSPAQPERDPEAIEFSWPARGKVLAGFSESSNKGLDIGGRPGDPVLAAAPGRVMYTGTGIRGYGKLIVIKHDNNFNSVYAHNREILVKEGQNVTRGQRIAELGDTDADAPKLHFEIRKSGKPVDPMRYLPAP
jgi:lipoprotein NlpD